ncbi:hypothetical protein DC522_02950 [Microvirga sp. KLBC 81]|uniref:hypothetical protein n=1 Tax=Microvirga sp. KLBC 81 TaxID=1862707 RepID=UPI000D51E8DF|nr:hypothetical protein [Microvirga sp. KLBC 81]PVE25748.1 hypothetical protein DC522_02950 [Microvirga sp. KLBC 81]
MRLAQNGSSWSAGAILLGAIVFAVLLAAPGVTITASYVNDLFIFLDGAHRIASGQIPNRDFHTALGPLSFYIPAWGYWLSGTMGGAMPSGMALATLVLAMPIAHVLSSRLHPILALPYGLFLLLVLAAPLNLGESITALSFAMFYNRIGWAALGALLIMYLRPERCRPWQEGIDAVSAAVLTLVMLYTKITYGLVALTFLTFLLSDSRQRRWVAAAIALILISGIGIEAFWRSTPAYIADLVMSAQVSGSRSPADLTGTFIRHLADYTLLGIFAALVLPRTRSLRDLLFFGFCTVPGLLIQNQNSQPWGILTIHAGAAVAAEMILRLRAQHSSQEFPPSSFATGAPLPLMAMILPTLLHCFMALGLHTAMAVARSGKAFDLPKFAEVRLIAPWLSEKRTLMHVYLESIESGARALESLPEALTKVSVLDFANPFSVGLGLPPPRGDSAWLHWNRNVNASHFIPPEQYFSDVNILMLPKWGINHAPLRELYQAYIDANFEPLHDTEGWIIYRRKTQEVATKAPF